MRYFVTGGTGLIGRNLIPLLLDRRGDVQLLVRPSSNARLTPMLDRFSDLARARGASLRIVLGDITAPNLGLEEARFDHVFHLAALYDLGASEQKTRSVNVDGTRNLIETLLRFDFGGVLHHLSSIAVAGDYAGLFTEAMLEEGQRHPLPYHRSKFESERLVRAERRIRHRIYRPSAVVGHSKTGEMDRIDGAYYMVRAIHILRDMLPKWAPLPSYDSAPINMVPVDYVARALDHIAHAPSQDGKTFHIVDPDPPKFKETFNLIADAAGAPRMGKRGLGGIKSLVPGGEQLVDQLGATQFLRSQILEDLEIPAAVIPAVNREVRYEVSNTRAALYRSGIECPEQRRYVEPMWDYYYRNLDPERDKEARNRRHLANKRILITGASSGIGEALAKKCARAGAEVILVARREQELSQVVDGLLAEGCKAAYITADLASMEVCDSVVEQTLTEHGPLDVLVNNAGHSIRRPLAESLDRFHDLERLMQINYFAPARLIRGFLPSMREAKTGQVINVLSAGANIPSPRFGAYTASKAALAQLGDTLAAELMDERIYTTGVFLPWVRTPMMDATGHYRDTDAMTPERAADWIITGIIHKKRRVVNTSFTRRYIFNLLTPKMTSRIINVLYRVYADDPTAHPELELDRSLLKRFIKGRLM